MLTDFCNFPLDTSGVVIGWMGEIWSVISIFLYSFGLKHLNQSSKPIAYTTIEIDIDDEFVKQWLTIALSILIALNAINLVASALLIIGIKRERHLLLLPWLTNFGISLLFIAANTIGVVFTAILKNVTWKWIFAWTLQGGIILGFFFYVWYAILSLYKLIEINHNLSQQRYSETSPLLPARSSTSIQAEQVST